MAQQATAEELAAGRGYEGLFVPALFSAWTKHVVEAAGISEGNHVLDVACGSGVLARHARAIAGAQGRVVGLDPAAGMIAAAAEAGPGIEWVQAAAEAIPFSDTTFDAVISQFGMMFFGDKERALSEMLRVVKPGGTLAVAVWDSIANNPAYGDISTFIEEHLGPAAGDALRLPFCLGNAGAVVALVENAGFTDAILTTPAEEARFPNPRTIVEADLRGWLPLFGITPDESTIASILDESDSRLAKYTAASGEAAFAVSAHIIAARKPR